MAKKTKRNQTESANTRNHRRWRHRVQEANRFREAIGLPKKGNVFTPDELTALPQSVVEAAVEFAKRAA